MWWGQLSLDAVATVASTDFDWLLAAVGRRADQLRKRAGLSQEALAERLGVSVKYVQRVLAGQENLSLRSLGRLALALGATAGQLLSGARAPRIPIELSELPCFPTLRAAAGAASHWREDLPVADVVRLPRPGARADFAVRAVGDSMAGGTRPVRSGDWLLMRWDLEAPPLDLLGLVVLAEVPDRTAGVSHLVKRLRRRSGGLWLDSDRAGGPRLHLGEGTRLLARLVESVRPETLAPRPGTLLPPGEALVAFGLPAATARSRRHHGHAFLVTSRREMLVATPGLRGHPGETAFVLLREPAGSLRYLGLADWDDEARRWRFRTAGG